MVIAVTLLGSCTNKDNDVIETETGTTVTPEKTDVKTYQIIRLTARSTLSDKYKAKFGGIEIDLVKTSDTTLAFTVPKVNNGGHLLDFELGKVSFNVTQTNSVDPAELVTNIFEKLDNQIEELNPTSAEEIEIADDIKKYKNEVQALFNSLTAEQKEQMAGFYEANKATFKKVSENIFRTYDGPTTFSTQSGCPRTDFKSFYGCTASNLAQSSMELTNALIEMGTFAGLGYVSAMLAPASFGLGAGVSALAFVTAGYLLITEVRPSFWKFGRSVFPFLEANWLFSKGLFLHVKDKFTSDASIDLNLEPKFRTISNADAGVNAGTALFISAHSKISGYWNKFTKFFGALPSYKTTEQDAILATNEIQISNISNANVQLISQSGQSIKFKSVSGKKETFNYRITVSKEGFVETKDLTAEIEVSALKVGDTYAGGTIFYLDETKLHGLVVSEELGRFQWDSTRAANGITYSPPTIGGLGLARGTGATNTTKIINVSGTNAVAASRCRNYRGGGYDDWFLPSLDELSNLYDALSFNGGGYWSSSEYVNGGTVYAYYYSYGGNPPMNRASFDNKFNEKRVVAVRAF